MKMKKSVKKTKHVVAATLLWGGGVFFLLGGLTYFDKSIIASIMMLLLGLVLIPPTWQRVKSTKLGMFNTKFRVILSLVLLIIAIQVSPIDTTTEPVARVETSVASGIDAPKQVNQKENIVTAAYDNDKYVLKGAGAANTEYSLRFNDEKSLSTKTDANGIFSIDIPDWAGVFGFVELTRDTNGWWFGGGQTYAKGYYVLANDNPLYSNDLPKPVVLGVGGSGVYEVSGYYLPDTELVLKSGNEMLSATDVDGGGRYQFNNITLDSNYKSIVVYERVSTGWLNSEEHKLTDEKYIAKNTHQILNELPMITKKEFKTQAISYDTRTIKNNSLSKGKTKVVQQGKVGERTVVYQVTYKGEQEVDRKIVSEKITRPPITKITNVGTYVAPVYTPPPAVQSNVYYRNCSAARAAGAAPVYAGEPGYGRHLDRDGDGVGCE